MYQCNPASVAPHHSTLSSMWQTRGCKRGKKAHNNTAHSQNLKGLSNCNEKLGHYFSQAPNQTNPCTKMAQWHTIPSSNQIKEVQDCFSHTNPSTLNLLPHVLPSWQMRRKSTEKQTRHISFSPTSSMDYGHEDMHHWAEFMDKEQCERRWFSQLL